MSRESQISQSHATITFEGRYRPEQVAEVCRCITKYLIAKPERVLLDFGPCTEAFPNSMLPLVAICSRLRAIGYDFYAFLPKVPEVKRRFMDTNWAHYLSPNVYKLADDFSEPHLAVKHYRTNEEHYAILQRILDLVMRTVNVPRSALTSLEWSLSEIMDNVLVHSESPVGGFVQLAIFPPTKKLAFTVADAGRGILESLREGIPALRSDRIAIEEAVRSGVTRNKDIGQGNGLSGSLALATRTGGRFRIRSGQTEIVWAPPGPDIQHNDAGPDECYHGTVVDVQLPYGIEVDVGAILTAASKSPLYTPTSYSPTDVIETRHMAEDGKALILRMEKETTGFGSRLTGTQMRAKAQNLLQAERHLPLVIDWDGVQIIASSYADEFLGKLFVELGPVEFMARTRLLNMVPLVQTLINRAILQRAHQSAGIP